MDPAGQIELIVIQIAGAVLIEGEVAVVVIILETRLRIVLGHGVRKIVERIGAVITGDFGVLALLVEAERLGGRNLLDTRLVHFLACGLAQLLAHGHRQIGEHTDGPPSLERVQCCLLDAVRFGDSNNVDRLNIGLPKDVL